MTDPKQELLALIDRLDPERQAILLQYAHGLEQAGPLLEKWVEEFKIAEERRHKQMGFDAINTTISSILDSLDVPTDEFPLFLATEILTCLTTIRGYAGILMNEPNLASIALTPPPVTSKKDDPTEWMVSRFLKTILDNVEYAIHLNYLPPLYARYKIRRLPKNSNLDS